MARFRPPKARGTGGFTLVEVLVAMAVFAIFMIGILNLLDTSTKVSEIEKAIADTQENVRFAAYHVMRTARMMGGARMPFADTSGTTADWQAGRVDSNVTGPYLTPYTLGSVNVLSGTDVLTVRGFFEIQPFFVDATKVNGSLGRIDIEESENGRVINTDMNSIEADLLTGRGLVFMGKLNENEYAVGQVGPGSTLTGASPDRQLQIAIADDTSSWWSALNPGGGPIPPAFDVYQVGVMETYTYYVDPDFRLMRLRVDGSAGGATAQPVAVSIGGLQVTLGVDTNNDGQVDSWQGTPTAGGVSGNRVLSMRITVLGRTPLGIPGWEEPAATFDVANDTMDLTDFDRSAKWRRVEVVATLRNFLF